MFTDVNESDARAAVKVWGQTVAREHGVPASPDPLIFKDYTELLNALSAQRVDAVGITLPEYAKLSQQMRFGPIFITYNSGSITEEYVLLVHQSSPVGKPDDLADRTLLVHENPRSSVAQFWLDSLLAEQGLKPIDEFVEKITRSTNITKVVLPVFFRQIDACLVTRSSFSTMAELNPQVGKQLRIIAGSPAIVPTVLVFRANYEPEFKQKILDGLRDLHNTPAGRQVLTVFRSEKMEQQPAASLQSSIALLERYARLLHKQILPLR